MVKALAAAYALDVAGSYRATSPERVVYRIAFAPQGRRVLILEAAGEVDALEGHRAAIDAATSALTTR